MPYLVDLLRGRLRSAEHGPLGAGMGDAGLDALAKDLAFEFGEHRQHPGEGTTARCRHVEGFGEGDEADSEFDQLFERDHEIGERTAPPVQPPDDDGVHLTATDGGEQLLTLWTLERARSHLSDLSGDLPASPLGVLPHGLDLERKRLLIGGGDPGVEGDLERAQG